MKPKPNPPEAVRPGSFNILKVNTLGWDWRDLYHWILTLRWPTFIAFLLGVYLAVNILFAVIFALGGACIEGMPPHSFSDAFYFSVETLATVGYGHMYPSTGYGHLVVTTEIMVGMFGTAVMTGIIFVRFSRPTARLTFSRSLVLSNFDGRPALMMRVANQRHQPMAEAEFRLMMIRHEPTLEDPTMFRFHTLRLQVDRLLVFPAAVTIRHLIDDASPLHGVTPELFEQQQVRFMASIVCVDTVLHTPIHSDWMYSWRDVRIDHRFAEIYSEQEDGRTQVDYARLHETQHYPPGAP